MSVIHHYVDKNVEKFNKDTIYFRDRHSILEQIVSYCKAFEVVEYVKFLGLEYEDDESKTIDYNNVFIEETRAIEVKIKFEVNFKGEKEIIERIVYVPKLINNWHFKINGVNYFPIYQLIDKAIFADPKYYSLKTLLMPMRFKHKKTFIKEYSNMEEPEKIHTEEFLLYLFKVAINYLYYFFAKFGYKDTLKFFGFGDEDDIVFHEYNEDEDYSEVSETHKIFFLNNRKRKFMCLVNKNKFNNDTLYFIYSLIDIMSKHYNENKINDNKYWLKILGAIFTKSTNNQIDKANKVLFSLERIMSEESKRLIDEIPEEDKQDTYTTLRWMIYTYNKNKYIDNMSLDSKRLQCYEYILYPLLKLFSNATTRIMNTRNLTLKTITGVFNIKKNFFIKRMIRNELIRYKGSVNNFDLFNCALKITFKNTRGSGEISDKYRGIHPSFIGCIDLITSSASDPGMSGCISPFAKISDNGIFETK